MKRNGKRALAALLAVLMAASSAPFAMAADTLPYIGESAKGENQPYQHGYRAEDFLDWSPETDPWGDMLRAEVPLQNRNEAFAATQANPNLSPETEYFALSGDYGNSFFDSYPYTNEFSQYLFNFWQYTDYYGGWHGMPTEEVPEEMYNAEGERNGTADWSTRYFEFGLVNLPNPAYTNAAHKNGVLSVGCIFLPRTGLKHTKFLTQDENGNFPYADKLVEMAKYYGFDGYFINQEESIPAGDVELYQKFMKQIREDGIYVQWYDSINANGGGLTYQNEFNSVNSPFVVENGEQYASSIFLNYWWDKEKLTNSAAHAKSLGVNPLDVVFVGVEAGMYRFGQPYDLRDNIGEDGQPMNSIASLGADSMHHGIDDDMEGNAIRREKDEFQWMAFQRERMWWSGPFQDPSQASFTADRSTYPAAPEVGVDSNNFDGVAAYITERSVINGDTFVTNFNTGHGLEYAINGEISNEDEWSNINIQDILPTWQWWFETDGTKLKADFDYGDEYKKNYDNGAEDIYGKPGSFDFDLVGAYNGGSSLVVYGQVDAENFLHLYKTDLDVTDSTKVDVTFKKTSQDNVGMKLGVIFEDNTNEVVKLDIANSTEASDGWVTSTVDLSGYAGKQIAAFGLVFDGEAEDYQVNIGRIAYTSGESQKPAAPTGFTIDKAYDTNEMVVSWDMASYDDVKQYNLYAVTDGKEIYLGGTYDQVYYIKDIEQAIADAAGVSVTDVTVTPSETSAEAGSVVSFDAKVNGMTEEIGQVTLELKAVSEDGTESDPAVATHNYAEGVTNVEVTAEDGALNVTWEGGQADVVVTKEYSTDDRTWTASGNNGCTLEVPTGADADYARYTMTITTPDGAVTTYDGRMDDSYAKPYTGKVASNRTLEVPLAKDWYQMVYKTVTNGVESEESTITRYRANMPSIPGSVDSVMIKLIDYRGNKSEWVTIPNLTEITVTGEAKTVKAGESTTFTATVKNYAETDAVTWRIRGASDPNTAIDENGVLTVGEEEPNSTITVTATPVENKDVSASTTIQVDPLVRIRPESETMYRGDSQQYIVEKDGRPQPISNYEWSVSGATVEGTTIDSTGYLTVGVGETAPTLIITATKKGTELHYTTSVTVISTYSLQADVDEIYQGDTVNLTMYDRDTPLPSEEYTWSVEGAENENTVVNNGVLTVGAGETASRITVKAIDSEGHNAEIVLEIQELYALDPYTMDAERGKEYQFAVLNQKTREAADPTEFTWDLFGPYDPLTSEDTKVDENGLVTIGQDENCFYMYLTATNKETGIVYKSYVYNYGDSSDAESESLEMKTMPQANAAPKSDEVSQDVTWTVEGATSVHTRIDAEGNLTIGGDETAEVLTVHATSVADPSKSDTATVAVTPSKELLRKTYEYAQTLNTEGVVDSAVKFFEEAMANAKAVLDNPDATIEEINTAWDNLLEGIWGLGLVQGDKAMLEQLIARAEAMDEDKYVADNWQQLVDALANAKTVYDDGDALQGDVDAAANALLNAIQAQRYKADKSILEDLIHQANGIDTSLYTAESVQAFTAALKSANAVLADESLSEDEQATVDEAVATLSSAMDNLEKLSSDNGNTGSGDDSNTSDKDDTSSKDDPNKGPINKNPATGDNNLIALGALAVLLTSAGAFVVIRKKSRV